MKYREAVNHKTFMDRNFIYVFYWQRRKYN